MRCRLAGLAAWLCATMACALVPSLALGQTPDPLRLIPDKIDAVAKIENPRALYDAVYGHDVFQSFLKLDAVQAFYDTTNFRRAFQLLAYFEKELGHPRLELLDRLAGGGIAVAAKFDGKNTVAVVVQGKDEELTKKFVALARKIADQELARLDIKAKIETDSHRGHDIYRLGNDFHFARAGSALLFSNRKKGIDKMIDLSVGGDKNTLAHAKFVAEVKDHLPKNPLVWGALNLEQIKEIQNVKNTLDTLSLDPTTMFLIGGLVDVIKRSPYVCAGVARDGPNFSARVVMPRGREGMAPLAAMFLPEDDKGTLPMLQPPRVLSSTGYYLDLGKFWDSRAKILTPEQAKTIDNFEAQTGKYLKGMSLGTILSQAGKYHRIVVTIPETSPYKIKPLTQTGSFAIVLDMRDQGFAKSMNTILRGAALAGTFQFGMRMVEEKHKEHTLVTYYFNEKKKIEADQQNIRFNFSPCFTHVGNQFVIASTFELGKDLIDCLEKESKDGTSPATSRTHVFGPGLAANVRQAEELIVAQGILGLALPPAQAKKQFDELTRIVERLGRFEFETRYNPHDFRFDTRWEYSQQKRKN